MVDTLYIVPKWTMVTFDFVSVLHTHTLIAGVALFLRLFIIYYGGKFPFYEF